MTDDDLAQQVERINEQLNYISGQFGALALVTAQTLSAVIKHDHDAATMLADGIRDTAEAIASTRGDVPRSGDVHVTGLLHTMRQVASNLTRTSEGRVVDQRTVSS